MLNFDTRFRRTAAKLKSPTSAAYDKAQWDNAFKEHGDGSADDLGLLEVADWISGQSAFIRGAFQKVDLRKIGANLATIMAIAISNRNYNEVVRLHDAGIKEARKNGAVSADHLAALQIEFMPGKFGNSDELVEIIVDATESWVYDALRTPATATIPEFDLLEFAKIALLKYTFQKGLNNLWNQSLYEGWHIEKPQPGELVWSPGDRQLETLIYAWQVREQSNFLNSSWLDITNWKKMTLVERKKRGLPKTVLGVTRKGNKRKFSIGQLPGLSSYPPRYALETAGIEGTYFNVFVDRDFPKSPGLTVRILVQAWHVLADLAQRLNRQVERKEDICTDDLPALSLIISREDLSCVMKKALDVNTAKVDSIIEFLTYTPKSKGDKAYRGLWTSPLVNIPQTSHYCLSFPVLVIGNPARRIAAWLEQGGVDDQRKESSRGIEYETQTRQEICAAIDSNILFANGARCAAAAIKKHDSASGPGEEIDLVIQLGGTLIVGEVKCFLGPAESIELFQFFKKLKGAADQARKKAEFLSKRRDVVGTALGIAEDVAKSLRVIPIVVINHSFGFSMEVDGCRVIDASFLKLYLSSPSLVTEMIANPKFGTPIVKSHSLYSDLAGAEKNFDAEMSDPYVLRRFLNRIDWVKAPMPVNSDEKFFVEKTLLKDATESRSEDWFAILAKQMSTARQSAS